MINQRLAFKKGKSPDTPKKHPRPWKALLCVFAGAAASALILCPGKIGPPEAERPGRELVERAQPHNPAGSSLERIRRPRHPVLSKALPASDAALVESIRERFTFDTTSCQKQEGLQDFDPLEYARYFGQGSSSLGNPLAAPSRYSPPISLLENLENAQSTEALFITLEYLDSIAVVETLPDGKLVPLVERYARESLSDGEGMSYDAACVALTGEAFNVGERAVSMLIDLALENGSGIREAADRMPQGFHEVFNDRLAIALFEDDASFDPVFTDRMLLQLSDAQKWDLFNNLLPFVYVNPSYRATARRVLEASDDEIVRAGIMRIFSAVSELDGEV